jgi:hypothetical protein
VPNTFDILEVAPDAVRITRWQLEGDQFRPTTRSASISRDQEATRPRPCRSRVE